MCSEQLLVVVVAGAETIGLVGGHCRLPPCHKSTTLPLGDYCASSPVTLEVHQTTVLCRDHRTISLLRPSALACTTAYYASPVCASTSSTIHGYELGTSSTVSCFESSPASQASPSSHSLGVSWLCPLLYQASPASQRRRALRHSSAIVV